METKTFEKVFIKSEEDYPKEEGNYFCCMNGFCTFHHLIPYTGEKTFMREIDWYLKPVDLRPVGKEGVMNCIDAEPELPGEMLNEIYDSVQGDKNALVELLRITVRATKQGIKDRIATELSEVREPNCNNTCKWFKVGYGHCNLCSRNTARLYEHGKDNYEPISGVTESEPKDGIKESRLSEEKISAILDSMNYETSKEREDAYDLCQILLSELSSPQEEAVNPFCPYCGKYKTMQGNGIMHQLCECGVQGKEVSQSRQKSEEVAGQVTDEEIKDKSKEFINLYGYSTTLLLSEFAKWLRSRLQPAQSINDKTIENEFCKALIHIKEDKVINEAMRKKIYKGLKSAFKGGHISIHSTYENVIDVIIKALR